MTLKSSIGGQRVAHVSDVDLVAILVVSGIGLAFVAIPQLSNAVIRPVVEIPLLIFVPGYALLAAFFPRNTDLSDLERVALSFGLSVVVVPFLAFGLNSTVWGVGTQSVSTSIVLFVGASTAAAFARRRSLPRPERFGVRLGTVASIAKTLVPGSDNRHSAIVILLVGAILFSASALTYSFLTSEPRESYTELYLLGPSGTMQSYPTNFTLGQAQQVTVAVANHEGADTNYTLIVTLNGSRTSSTLDTENLSVANGGTWQKNIGLAPNSTGHNMQIQFTLYRDTDLTAPYRETYLLVNVT